MSASSAQVEPDAAAVAAITSSVDRTGWNEFLHSLRTAELRRVPLVDDAVVLSVGCAGRWYFDWVADCLKARIGRHVGVEAYSPRPDDLPPGAEWIAESVGAGTSLAGASVDLVIAGQVIEHFWVEEVVTFLAESWRLLRPGGRMVIDSPNRRVTDGVGWWQPEHTMEFTPDEALELLDLAGFDVPVVRGLWSCYDPAAHRFLPLEPDFEGGGWGERLAHGRRAPEDAFCWWFEAVKTEREPDRAALTRRVASIAHDVVPRARRRRVVGPDVERRFVDHRDVARATDALGVLRFGPYVPLPAGSFDVEFDVRAGTPPRWPDQPALHLDVVCGGVGDEVLASRVLTGGELDATWQRVTLPVHVDAQRFGVQYRAFAHQPGVEVDLDVRTSVRLAPTPPPDRPGQENDQPWV